MPDEESEVTNERPKDKVYLGDSVYAEWKDGYYLKLTTNNGAEDSNTIYLEPQVLKNLMSYLKG